jgi:drug/metabolite transporter (DMT)-like permease
VLLGEVPVVLRQQLYAIPALLGAAVVAVADVAGSTSGLIMVIGAAVCLALRLIGLRYRIDAPAPVDALRATEPPDKTSGLARFRGTGRLAGVWCGCSVRHG